MSRDAPDMTVEQIWADMNAVSVSRREAAVQRSTTRVPTSLTLPSPMPAKIVDIDRLASLMQAKEKQKRIQALSGAVDLLRTEKNASKIVHIQAHLLKHVLRSSTDRFEQCRVLALEFEHDLVQKLPLQSLMSILPLLVPVLRFRLANSDSSSLEPSEELRTVLFKICLVVMQRGRQVLSPYFDDMVQVLLCGAVDSSPDVEIAACDAMLQLEHISKQKLHSHSKALILSIRPLLTHRRSQVRLAAIRALQTLMYHGAGETIRELTAFREHNVIPYKAFFEGEVRQNTFAVLVEDKNPRVRQAFYDMVQTWRVDLPERMDYETLLTPYVLSGLTDDIAIIQQNSIEAIDRIGQQYEQEYEEDLKDQQRFSKLLCHPDDHLEDILPPPFTRRPRLGSKLVFGSMLQRFLPAIANELKDWRRHSRSKAARLLCVLLYFSERSVGKHIHDVLDALCSLLPLDSRSEELNTIHHCFALVGRYGTADLYLPHVCEYLERESGEVITTQAISLLLPAMPPAQIAVNARFIFEKILMQNYIESSNDETVQRCILQIANFLLPELLSDEEMAKHFELFLLRLEARMDLMGRDLTKYCSDLAAGRNKFSEQRCERLIWVIQQCSVASPSNTKLLHWMFVVKSPRFSGFEQSHFDVICEAVEAQMPCLEQEEAPPFLIELSQHLIAPPRSAKSVLIAKMANYLLSSDNEGHSSIPPSSKKLPEPKFDESVQRLTSSDSVKTI